MGILDPLPQWRSHRSRRCQKVLVFKCNYAGLRWPIYATAKGQYFFGQVSYIQGLHMMWTCVFNSLSSLRFL